MNSKLKLAAVLVTALTVFALMGCGNKGKDLVGIWRLSALNGKEVNAHAKGAGELPGFELRDTGTYTMPSFGTSGSYTVDGDTLTMHTEKYNNQSKDEFMREMEQKHPNDPAMKKLGEQLFADFVLHLDADGKTLTAKSGQNSQSFHRVATRTPTAN